MAGHDINFWFLARHHIDFLSRRLSSNYVILLTYLFSFDSAPQLLKIKSLLPGSLEIIGNIPCSLKRKRLSPQLPKPL